MTTSKIVDFDQPPVVEVVCGVSFNPLPGFTVAHLGQFWSELGSSFAEVKEVPPLPALSESFGGPAASSVVVQLTPEVLTMPRVWFISDKDDHLVQVQRDRFLCNWRKLTAEHAYPSYDWVITKFNEHLLRFEKFSDAHFGVTPTYTQYELTYINHIIQGQGWATLAELGAVVPDCAWRSDTQRFLPTPEGVNWNLSFAFPGQTGRLHVRLQSGERADDRRTVLAMDLTARGFEVNRDAWFDRAHEWIVEGFADLTAQGIQSTVWRRTK